MSSGEGEGGGEHPWALIGRRLKLPCRQWTFYVVLILGILVLGYLAVWIEVVRVWDFKPSDEHPQPNLESLRLAYATAILAVGAPCFMQLVLTLNKMAAISGFVLLFLFAFMAYCVSNAEAGPGGVHFYGVVGLFVATLLWWLANGEDELFQDRVPFNAGSGGDPRRDLKGGKNNEVKV
jgi:MFS family permease